MQFDNETLDSIRLSVMKIGPNRSYDDILTIKQYLVKLDFMKGKTSGLHPKQINDLCMNVSLETFYLNDSIFKQDDTGDKLYFVFAGTADVWIKFDVDLGHNIIETKEKMVFTLTSGCHFGEKALETDAPRAASVIVSSDVCEVLSITKNMYLTVINNYASDSNIVKAGSKESVMKILSKAKDKRSVFEIEEVANFLKRRIPFFSKFEMNQMKELARVSESLVVWGQQILFKQGSLGQAFYVIITGSVEVWVNSPEGLIALKAAEASLTSNKSGNKTDGLGQRVALLPVGAYFGERALENDNSHRMASVVTSEQITELIVISKEDYISLVQVMTDTESMEKLTLLRKTHLFRDLDVSYLKQLTKFMEPKKYRLDEVIYKANDKATEMIFIHTGECRVELTVEVRNKTKTSAVGGNIKSTATAASAIGSTNGRLQRMNLGRIGPCAVMCEYITQCSSYYEAVYNTETVVANSLMVAYSVGKNDFFHHLSSEARNVFVQAVAGFNSPALPYLWDIQPKQMNDDEWKKTQTWSKFKDNFNSNIHGSNIIETYKTYKDVELLPSSCNTRAKTITHATIESPRSVSPTGTAIATATGTKASTNDMLKKTHKDKHFNFADPKFDDNKFIDTYLTRSDTVTAANNIMTEEEFDRHRKSFFSKRMPRYQRKALQLLYNHDDDQQDATAATAAAVGNTHHSDEGVSKDPFSIIHFHREAVKISPAYGSRRPVRCHMRFCGTSKSTSSAKALAAAIMKNAYLKLYRSNIYKEHETSLNWTRFIGYDAIPLQSTDHFIIYCRNAPLEYASLVCTQDMLLHEFPPACKRKEQRYCTVSLRSIGMGNYTDVQSTQQQQQPLFLSEISILNEVLSTSSTYMQACRHAKQLLIGPHDIANSFISINEDNVNAATGSDATDSYANTDAVSAAPATINGNADDATVNTSTSVRLHRRGTSNSIPSDSDADEFSVVSSDAPMRLRICCMPLFDWVIISNESIDLFDVQSMSNDIDAVVDDVKYSNELLKEKQELLCSLTDTNIISEKKTKSKAFEVGINGPILKHVDEDRQVTAAFTMKSIEREVFRRELSKEVNKMMNDSPSATVTTGGSGLLKRLNSIGNNASGSALHQQQQQQQSVSDNDGVGDKNKLLNLAAPEVTIEALGNIIRSTRMMIDMNDSLCMKETGVGNSNSSKSRSGKSSNYDGKHGSKNGSDSDDEDIWVRKREKSHDGYDSVTKNPTGGGMGLLTQRMALFDTLHELPLRNKMNVYIKDIKQSQRQKEIDALCRQSHSNYHNSSNSVYNDNISLAGGYSKGFPINSSSRAIATSKSILKMGLSSKMDALQDMLASSREIAGEIYIT